MFGHLEFSNANGCLAMINRYVLSLLLTAALPMGAMAQSPDSAQSALTLELNAVQDVGDACRLTFVVTNQTGTAIEKAVFETVVFDPEGGVTSLTLFDFRDLPLDRPRVRQFDLPGMPCASVGRALINGANSCLVEGAQSSICQSSLSLSSRLDVELIG